MDAGASAATPRRVIITGGSGAGIGAAIADACEARGCQVLRMQRRAPERGEWRELDLRWQLARIRPAVEQAISQLGGLDWLVLASGVGAYMPALYGRKDADAHEWQAEEQLRTNLTGPAFVFESSAEALMRGDGEPSSRVLYLGSTIVRQPPKALAYYAASKAGAEAFFRAEARRWAGRGIRINVLATGWTESPMVSDLLPRVREKILRAIALGRMATSAEAADMALRVLDGPDYLCGEVLTMSGGI